MTAAHPWAGRSRRAVGRALWLGAAGLGLAALWAAPAGTVGGFISPLVGDEGLEVPETVVPAGSRSAAVHVRLREALRRPVRFRYLTRNGTALQDAHYRRASGSLLFLPGETEKIVTVPLLRDLGDRRFELTVGWPKFDPPFGANTVGRIRGGAGGDPVARLPQPRYAPAQRQAGRRLVFQTRFDEPVRDKNKPGEWRSGFAWGRVQTGNGELAPYTDARLHGTDPHPMADGHRQLRAEHRPVTVKGKRYDYSSAMLASRGMVPGWRYGYFELRVKLPRAQGTTPAFWLLPDHDSEWPPEIDIFEVFQRARDVDHPGLTSSIHWRRPDGGTGKEGVELPFPEPFGWHVIGFDWTPEWMVTFVDGKEVVRRPTIFHRPMYVILNIAVGGLTEAPRSPDAFPASMELDYLRVWQ